MIRTKNIKISEIEKQQKDAFYGKLYGNPKSIEFETNPNMKTWRGIKKDFIVSDLSPAAKAIYPVLCSLSDFKKIKDKRQVSMENIGKFSGLKNWSIIANAIDELKRAKYLKCEKISNERKYWIYEVDFVRKSEMKELKDGEEKLPYIQLHTCIIKSGIWSYLTPKEQSLYLTLRKLGKFEFDPSSQANYDDRNDAFVEEYNNRTWEYYNGTAKYLRDLAGISRNDKLGKMLKSLKDYGLVGKPEWVNNDLFVAVNLYPKSLLNKEGKVNDYSEYEDEDEDEDEEYEDTENTENNQKAMDLPNDRVKPVIKYPETKEVDDSESKPINWNSFKSKNVINQTLTNDENKTLEYYPKGTTVYDLM